MMSVQTKLAKFLAGDVGRKDDSVRSVIKQKKNLFSNMLVIIMTEMQRNVKIVGKGYSRNTK